MDLITLQDYKTYTNMSAKPDDDDKLSFLITSASSLIQTYLGIDYSGSSGQLITETVSHDYQTDTIFLKKYPISGITSVTLNNYYTQDSTVHVPLTVDVDYYADLDDGIVTILKRPVFLNTHLSFWPRFPNTTTIVYNLPILAAGMSEVPAEIKLACILLVRYYAKEEYVPTKSIQSSSIVNSDRQNQPTANGKYHFPQHIQVILDRYLGG